MNDKAKSLKSEAALQALYFSQVVGGLLAIGLMTLALFSLRHDPSLNSEIAKQHLRSIASETRSEARTAQERAATER